MRLNDGLFQPEEPSGIRIGEKPPDHADDRDGEKGDMLYIHLYRDLKNKLKDYPCETSLQKGARDFFLKGGRFNTTGMMILKEEVLSRGIYYTQEDEESFHRMMKEAGMEEKDA